MKLYTAIIEKCSDTGLYVGFVPGFPGAHYQAKTLGELIWDIFQCFILHTRLADEPFSHSFLC